VAVNFEDSLLESFLTQIALPCSLLVLNMPSKNIQSWEYSLCSKRTSFSCSQVLRVRNVRSCWRILSL